MGKRNKGITLIALVITIIVLIILAGISINLLMGDNGIIKKAQIAGAESEKASDLEKMKLAVMEALIDEKTTGNNNLEQALRNNLDSSKLQSVSSNGTVAKINYNGKEYSVDLKNGTASESIVDKWDGVSKSTGLVGEGTDAKPYLISNGSDFNYFAEILSEGADITGLNADKSVNDCNVHGSMASYKLTSDISLENHKIYTLGGIPDGNGSDRGRSFYGVFDGDNHEISNIKIESTQYNAALFGHTYGAIIKNLILTNIDYKGKSDVGGIVGSIHHDNFMNNRPTTIQNCSVTGKVIADKFLTDSSATGCSNVGGIVGGINGTAIIENCTANVEIVGDYFVGGLVGWINNGRDNVLENENYGVKIINCVANGKIEADHQFGGLVGDLYGANFINCVSNMEIKVANKSGTTRYIGGLVGYMRGYSKIENSYATGNITINRPVEYLGSLIGFALVGTVNNCYNTGNMTCTDTVNKLGGLYGEIHGGYGEEVMTFVNTRNTGNITFDLSKKGTEVGKLVGRIIRGTQSNYELTGCINTGSFPISQDIGVDQ